MRHGRRRKGAGAWDLSYGFRALLLPKAEEGTKEEDDAGGPLVSQRGVNNGVARGRLRGVTVAATAGGADGRAGVGDAQLTRGPRWQRQLAGLGARAAAVAWAYLLGLCARAGLAGPSGWLRGPLLLFLFLFFISFPLFEFKFGLDFEFKTDVTYSLEFREFCLAILYNKNRCGFVVQK